MPIEVKLYRVLIASPSDVTEERNIIREEIARWNSMHTESMKIILQSTGWETDATPDLNERGQAVINRQLVDNCDLLIGIFWTRIGTPTVEAESGTVEEIKRAVNQGKRCIVYFSSQALPQNNFDQKQYDRLQEYKQELNKRGLTSQYENIDDFKEKISRHIVKAIQEITKEDKERRAAEKEAKITEKVLELPTQPVSNTSKSDITFTTLSNAQKTVKHLLGSRFGIQDMEDAKEEEINKIKTVLNSPDLANILAQKSDTKSISAICQIMETASTPSMLAVSSIAKYGDDNSEDLLEIVGDWIERLSTRKSESGYIYISRLKTYPGLLTFYSVGISALRSGKIEFLKKLMERKVYSSKYQSSQSILYEILSVFDNDLGKMIEPGFEKKLTPVSDHLAPLIKSKLYPNEEEERYLNWFDLFEFLTSLKTVEFCGAPFPGSFVWRRDTKTFMIKAIQEAIRQNSKLGKAVLRLFDDTENLKKIASRSDQEKIGYNFLSGASYPSYISQLIEWAEKGKTVADYNELLRELRENKIPVI